MQSGLANQRIHGCTDKISDVILWHVIALLDQAWIVQDIETGRVAVIILRNKKTIYACVYVCEPFVVTKLSPTNQVACKCSYLSNQLICFQ